MNKISKLLVGEDKSASEEFNDKVRNKNLSHLGFSDYPESWVKIHFKTYPRLDKKGLKKFKQTKLTSILRKRRSVRNFTGESIGLKSLSSILFNSGGISFFTKDGDYNMTKRNYPSAGARYPLEVYTLILNCEGVKKGLYHYNVKDNLLELLVEKDLSKWVIKALGGEFWATKSSVIIIITSILDRTKIKYGDRGYQYSLIEAGHLAQNISILSTELGLGSCAIGGFIDIEVDKLLDIINQKEFALYLIAVGKI